MNPGSFPFDQMTFVFPFILTYFSKSVEREIEITLFAGGAISTFTVTV